MDYTAIIAELNNASLFELYRLNVAIHQQLNDPNKLNLIKNYLTVGQLISYFDQTENRLLEATILKLKRNQVLVKNQHDGVEWNIPYYFINIDNLDTNINLKEKQKTNKNHIKVGDHVCFKDKQGNELFGEVIKLNPKTASISVGNAKWRVAYSLLSPIISVDVEENINSGAIAPRPSGIIIDI